MTWMLSRETGKVLLSQAAVASAGPVAQHSSDSSSSSSDDVCIVPLKQKVKYNREQRLLAGRVAVATLVVD